MCGAAEPPYLFGMVNDASDFRASHLRDRDFLGAFALIESDAGVLMVQNQRVIGGVAKATWDLPGGQVEPGELLAETLARELDEELGIRPRQAEFVFFQEGERAAASVRRYAWRSFFFRVGAFTGEPGTGAEALPFRWIQRRELPPLLTAPYHDSFLQWLTHGGTSFRSTWCD